MFRISFQYPWVRDFIFVFLLITVTACKKEHLQPDLPDPQPFVWVKGDLSGTPIDIAAGVNQYEAFTAVNDSLTYRSFSCSIFNTLESDSGKIEFRFNNFSNSFGIPEQDLDSTIHSADYNYAYAIPGTVSWLSGHISILYSKSTGEKYTTYKYTSQPQQGSSFFIDSFSKIQKDNKNYVQCKFHFNCKLYAMSGADTLNLNNGNGQIVLCAN